MDQGSHDPVSLLSGRPVSLSSYPHMLAHWASRPSSVSFELPEPSSEIFLQLRGRDLVTAVAALFRIAVVHRVEHPKLAVLSLMQARVFVASALVGGGGPGDSSSRPSSSPSSEWALLSQAVVSVGPSQVAAVLFDFWSITTDFVVSDLALLVFLHSSQACPTEVMELLHLMLVRLNRRSAKWVSCSLPSSSSSSASSPPHAPSTVVITEGASELEYLLREFVMARLMAAGADALLAFLSVCWKSASALAAVAVAESEAGPPLRWSAFLQRVTAEFAVIALVTAHEYGPTPAIQERALSLWSEWSEALVTHLTTRLLTLSKGRRKGETRPVVALTGTNLAAVERKAKRSRDVSQVAPSPSWAVSLLCEGLSRLTRCRPLTQNPNGSLSEGWTALVRRLAHALACGSRTRMWDGNDVAPQRKGTEEDERRGDDAKEGSGEVEVEGKGFMEVLGYAFAETAIPHAMRLSQDQTELTTLLLSLPLLSESGSVSEGEGGYHGGPHRSMMGLLHHVAIRASAAAIPHVVDTLRQHQLLGLIKSGLESRSPSLVSCSATALSFLLSFASSHGTKASPLVLASLQPSTLTMSLAPPPSPTSSSSSSSLAPSPSPSPSTSSTGNLLSPIEVGAADLLVGALSQLISIYGTAAVFDSTENSYFSVRIFAGIAREALNLTAGHRRAGRYSVEALAALERHVLDAAKQVTSHIALTSPMDSPAKQQVALKEPSQVAYRDILYPLIISHYMATTHKADELLAAALAHVQGRLDNSSHLAALGPTASLDLLVELGAGSEGGSPLSRVVWATLWGGSREGGGGGPSFSRALAWVLRGLEAGETTAEFQEVSMRVTSQLLTRMCSPTPPPSFPSSSSSSRSSSPTRLTPASPLRARASSPTPRPHHAMEETASPGSSEQLSVLLPVFEGLCRTSGAVVQLARTLTRLIETADSHCRTRGVIHAVSVVPFVSALARFIMSEGAPPPPPPPPPPPSLPGQGVSPSLAHSSSPSAQRPSRSLMAIVRLLSSLLTTFNRWTLVEAPFPDSPRSHTKPSLEDIEDANVVAAEACEWLLRSSSGTAVPALALELFGVVVAFSHSDHLEAVVNELCDSLGGENGGQKSARRDRPLLLESIRQGAVDSALEALVLRSYCFPVPLSFNPVQLMQSNRHLPILRCCARLLSLLPSVQTGWSAPSPPLPHHLPSRRARRNQWGGGRAAPSQRRRHMELVVVMLGRRYSHFASISTRFFLDNVLGNEGGNALAPCDLEVVAEALSHALTLVHALATMNGGRLAPLSQEWCERNFVDRLCALPQALARTYHWSLERVSALEAGVNKAVSALAQSGSLAPPPQISDDGSVPSFLLSIARRSQSDPAMSSSPRSLKRRVGDLDDSVMGKGSEEEEDGKREREREREREQGREQGREGEEEDGEGERGRAKRQRSSDAVVSSLEYERKAWQVRGSSSSLSPFSSSEVAGERLTPSNATTAAAAIQSMGSSFSSPFVSLMSQPPLTSPSPRSMGGEERGLETQTMNLQTQAGGSSGGDSASVNGFVQAPSSASGPSVTGPSATLVVSLGASGRLRVEANARAAMSEQIKGLHDEFSTLHRRDLQAIADTNLMPPDVPPSLPFPSPLPLVSPPPQAASIVGSSSTRRFVLTAATAAASALPHSLPTLSDTDTMAKGGGSPLGDEALYLATRTTTANTPKTTTTSSSSSSSTTTTTTTRAPTSTTTRITTTTTTSTGGSSELSPSPHGWSAMKAPPRQSLPLALGGSEPLSAYTDREVAEVTRSFANGLALMDESPLRTASSSHVLSSSSSSTTTSSSSSSSSATATAAVAVTAAAAATAVHSPDSSASMSPARAAPGGENLAETGDEEQPQRRRSSRLAASRRRNREYNGSGHDGDDDDDDDDHDEDGSGKSLAHTAEEARRLRALGIRSRNRYIDDTLRAGRYSTKDNYDDLADFIVARVSRDYARVGPRELLHPDSQDSESSESRSGDGELSEVDLDDDDDYDGYTGTSEDDEGYSESESDNFGGGGGGGGGGQMSRRK